MEPEISSGIFEKVVNSIYMNSILKLQILNPEKY